MLPLLKKININPLFWFVIGIGIITGYFREVLMVFIIVFIHEMGHSVAAHFFGWKIQKIELLPFGGVAEINEHGNRPIHEEFIVIVAGPLQHIWLLVASYICLPFDFWSVADHQVFVTHNLMILCFNLLPIWPLDGGRLFQLGCSLKWSFRQTQRITLTCSFAFLIVLTVVSHMAFPLHLNLWIVLLFLFLSHFMEWRQRHYTFMRFLMERFYHNQRSVKQTPIVVSEDMKIRDVVYQFRRGLAHTIEVSSPQTSEKAVFDEQVILQALFEEKKLNYTLKEAFKHIS